MRSSLLHRVIILLIVSAALAAVVNGTRSSGGIPWVSREWDHYVESKALKEGLRLASLEETRTIAEEGRYLLIDARPADEYLEGHLPAAISLPFAEVEEMFEQVEPMMVPESPLLVYCSGVACEDSYELALFLRERAFTNVVLFVGGFAAWEEAGLPVEGAP